MISIKLPLTTILNIHGALSQLDGYERVIDDGGKPRIIKEPYRFGEAVFALAKLRRVVREHVQDYTEARDNLIREISGGVQIDEENVDQLNRFTESTGKLLKREVDIELVKLTRAELNLTKNPIPPSVIDALLDVIE